jgi:hypothetical protein
MLYDRKMSSKHRAAAASEYTITRKRAHGMQLRQALPELERPGSRNQSLKGDVQSALAA